MCVVVDVNNSDEGAALARQLSVRVIPTQVFIDPAGNELGRHEGYISKDDMVGLFQQLGLPAREAGSARARMVRRTADERPLRGAHQGGRRGGLARHPRCLRVGDTQYRAQPLPFDQRSSGHRRTSTAGKRSSTRRAVWTATCFAGGVLVTLAIAGGIALAAGRLMGQTGIWGNIVVAVVLLVVGLYLLGAAQAAGRSCLPHGASPSRRAGGVDSRPGDGTGSRALRVRLSGAGACRGVRHVRVQPHSRRRHAACLRRRAQRGDHAHGRLSPECFAGSSPGTSAPSRLSPPQGLRGPAHHRGWVPDLQDVLIDPLRVGHDNGAHDLPCQDGGVATAPDLASCSARRAKNSRPLAYDRVYGYNYRRRSHDRGGQDPRCEQARQGGR